MWMLHLLDETRRLLDETFEGMRSEAGRRWTCPPAKAEAVMEEVVEDADEDVDENDEREEEKEEEEEDRKEETEASEGRS